LALQDTLDLHGLRWEEARTLLVQFVAQAVKRGQRCLLIIHGKGLRSKNQEPVLRGKVGGLARAARRRPRLHSGAPSRWGQRRGERAAARPESAPAAEDDDEED
jgi:DNA-nicking Smr family endonuclease